jgi:hypothetical protein
MDAFLNQFSSPHNRFNIISLSAPLSVRPSVKVLSGSVPIQNGLKEADAVSPLLFNFTLDYAVRKVQENQVGLKVNETHQLLDYADDVNLLEDNIDTIKKTLKIYLMLVRRLV